MNRPVDPRRDDVGRLAAVGDHAVHLVAGRQLLAQEPDGDLGDDHGVAGVDPLPGAAEAWAVRPVKATSKWETARQVASRRSVGPRVDHHRRVDVVEDAGVEHEHLAAAALLGRRAEHPDGEAELVGQRERAPSPAPTAVAAMMLWPQAWPTSGRASYSAQTASTRGPSPASATKAVGRPAVPVVDREAAALEGLGGQRRPSGPRRRRAPGGRGCRG